MGDNIFEKLTAEEQTQLWMYMIFNRDKIIEKMDEWTKEAEKRDMTLTEYLESINPLETNKEELPKLPIWLGKNCKNCGNEKCKKLGTLPKGYDCALWQPEKGHWIDREVYDADRWKCSECGRTEQYKENYCPSCGVKMGCEVEE